MRQGWLLVSSDSQLFIFIFPVAFSAVPLSKPWSREQDSPRFTGGKIIGLKFDYYLDHWWNRLYKFWSHNWSAKDDPYAPFRINPSKGTWVTLRGKSKTLWTSHHWIYLVLTELWSSVLILLLFYVGNECRKLKKLKKSWKKKRNPTKNWRENARNRRNGLLNINCWWELEPVDNTRYSICPSPVVFVLSLSPFHSVPPTIPLVPLPQVFFISILFLFLPFTFCLSP